MTKFIQTMALASVVALASCGKKDDKPTPTQPAANVSRAMFMNACVSSTALKVNMNDVAISSIAGIEYLTATSYLEVAPVSAAKTTFVFSSSNTKLAETTQNYEANKYYTVFAAGVVTNPSILVTEDDITAPAGTMAKVRLINLSPDDLNETMYVGNTKVASDIKFKQASSFVAVNAGKSNIIVQDPNNVPLSKTREMELQAGKVYTIVLTGTEGGSDAAALGITVLNNN